MHVLAFVNQKGGCGKTTTAVHLAGALAARGERVLLVDLDPQAHATLALGWAIEREPTVIDLLRERVTVHEAVLPGPGGIRLLAATSELAEFEEVAERMLAPEQVLKRALQHCAWSYDYVLLDCPPRTDGVLAANALRAADTAVLVIECGTFALQGALKASTLLEDLADSMERPFQLRAVGTMFDKRSRLARDLALALHAQFGTLLFDTWIRTSVRLRESTAAGLPVQLVDTHCRAAQDFAALADEIVAHAVGSDARAPATSTNLGDSGDEDGEETASISRASPVLAAARREARIRPIERHGARAATTNTPRRSPNT